MLFLQHARCKAHLAYVPKLVSRAKALFSSITHNPAQLTRRCATKPPARCTRSCSSGRHGLWSAEAILSLPPRHSTVLLSPTLAMYSLEPSTRLVVAVLPAYGS